MPYIRPTDHRQPDIAMDDAHHSNASTVLRGALVGCGFFAANQMRAWQELPGVAIAALCDRDAGRLAAFGDTFGIEHRFDDIETLLTQMAVDFVDIAAPTPAHETLVTAAAHYGVDIICQKPFAGSLATARRLINICRKHGVSLTVHENFRWQHAVRRVAELIGEGRIGRPFFGRISYRSGFDVFANQPYLATLERFIIQDLGIHTLDMARALFGDVVRLSCETGRVNPDIAGEDHATLMLRHEAGCVSVVDCSYATTLADDPFPQSLIEVDGDRGSIRLAADFQLTIHGPGGSATVEDVTPTWPAWSEAPWNVIQESVVALQGDWIERRRAREPAPTAGPDNFNTLALVEAAYQSAATGQSVEPERW
ncbi:oxidoreductase domain-containing protein [Salinisphaera hydrothermalis C41B8]|uniref:Oxidoreductase domain-containing protein n=2 Tax=Salinisphaera TaxID=180541 RepID=A0A084IJJ5_SALHC|nr:oxidoreductase domain-containing protein [Salinisphaera hydrothermalis C41B8]